MAEHVARKEMVLNGKTYKPGQRVPLDKTDPAVAKKLIEQRRVVPDSIRISGK